MQMKLNTVYRLFLEGVKSIRRQRATGFTTLGVTTASLAIFGLVVLLILNLVHLGGVLESRIDMRVFLKDGLTAEQQREVGDKLRRIPDVAGVVYVSRDEGLKRLGAQLGNREDLLAVVKDNPLPDTYVVKAKKPVNYPTIAAAARVLPGVEKATYGEEFTKKLLGVTRALGVLAAVGVAGLAAGIVFIIVNTIRLTVMARRREIEVMKLVGASDWYIRLPFIFEAVLVGLAGALIAAVIVRLVYALLVTKAQLALPFLPLLGDWGTLNRGLVLLVASGIVIGVVASAISIRRFLRV